MAVAVKTKTNKKILELKGTEKQIITKLVNASFAKNDKSKTAMILENFPLAVHVAKKYARPDCDIQDLVQVAAIGLIKAARKYNSAMKTRLSHYAIPTIEGEIRHYLRDNFFSIKVSRKYLELNARLQRYRETFMYENGREITDTEISKALKISLREIRKAAEVMKGHTTVSLDEPISSIHRANNSSTTRLEDIISQNNNVDRMLELESLNEALAALSHRDRMIIKDKFVRELGQVEIAKRYHITQAQVSRIIASSCVKMKAVLA